uniref:Uncharacterized protein n=1 Tax=Graphocephala atropunctata TaxID=36148 RepID=A0A1B6LQ39_9HEMI
MDLLAGKYGGLRGPFRTGLLFLFHLAWKSRVRLPVLIAIGFMVLDIRMHLEINIDLGRAGRQAVPLLGQGNNQAPVIDLDASDSEETYTGEEDSASYTTDSYTLHSECTSDSSDEEDELNNDQPPVTDDASSRDESPVMLR